MARFVWLLALLVPSWAWGAGLDAKTKALAHYIVGVCDDIQGDAAGAVNEYQQSVRLNAAESESRIRLGAYYLRMDRKKQALVQLKSAARLSPENAQAHYLLGLIYSSERKYDLAVSEYEAVLKTTAQHDPTNTEAYLYLGKLYFSEGKYAQAGEQFSRILQIDPANILALYLLGSVYADMHDPRAVDIYRKVLQAEPDHSEALNSLGYLYAEQGIHLDEAVRMVRRALEIDPANGANYDSLGWAYFKQGAFKEALMALQKAEKYITDPLLYEHIGDVYMALNENPRAVEYWRKSLDADPHQTVVKQKIKALEKWIASKSSHRLN